MKNKPEGEIIHIPKRFVRFAVRRTAAMVRALLHELKVDGLPF